MSVYGYIRVSSYDQNEDRQLIAMQRSRVPRKNIFIDKQSGKDFDRPAYNRMLRRLKRDDLVRILTEPKNAMTRQYQTLMSYDGVELEYEPEALEAIADRAIEMKIGARGLRSVVENVMTDIMYRIPSDKTAKKVLVTAESVREGTNPLVLHEGDPALEAPAEQKQLKSANE